MSNHRALIIGNGESRKSYDLNLIGKVYTTFGCNALYREFEPDYLLCIDPAMQAEIETSDFPKDKLIVPPYDEQFEPARFNPNRPRSNAGMNAMIEAIRLGYTDLYMIGFDFLYDDRRSVSNCYRGTNAYGAETQASFADTIARVNYFTWFARQHPTINFTFWFPPSENNFIRRIDTEDNVTVELMKMEIEEKESQ